MRIAFVLPGLNRIVRGAEVAFESIAYELAQRKDVKVTLFGSGEVKGKSPYDFVLVPSKSREFFKKWPKKIPIFRNEYVYEEISFSLNFIRYYNPKEFDITVTCCYPFINWYLRFRGGSKRPAHIFVTQNGDHPILANESEYAFFGCDGLVCTNPEYFERHKGTWLSTLIPNGVDPKLFYPRTVKRAVLGLPSDVPVALMVSALIEEKRVTYGIEFASEISNLHLVVCGDGPEYQKIQDLGDKMMPGRFHLRKFPRNQMPDVYREADLFLHMSMTEPSANAYIEALATGIPIVTHDRLVTRWTLEDAGILVDTTNKNAVVEGIKKAITMSSPEYALSCQSIVNSRYTWNKLSEEYYDFFFKVLESKKK